MTRSVGRKQRSSDDALDVGSLSERDGTLTLIGSSGGFHRRCLHDGLPSHDLADFVQPVRRFANRHRPGPGRHSFISRVVATIAMLRRIAAVASRHDLSRSRRGVAALEFALAATPFLIMIFGFMSTSLIFITRSGMQNSAYNAAFVMATGQVTSFQSKPVTCTGSLSTASAEYYACANLPGWATFTATATESCTAPASVTVQVSASASAVAGTDIYSFFSGKTVVTNATMMKQGTCP